MSLVVRNDFRQRKDIEATVSKLTETAEMLNRRLKTDELLLDFNYDENYFRIWDNREDDDFIDILLFDGFWLIDTAWRYHQYFSYLEERLWLRELLYKYVVLLGQKEAYTCTEYFTWNGGLLEDEESTTFEDWQIGCIKKLGHEIQPLDVEDVKLYKDTFYNNEPVYLDKFLDLKPPIF